MPDPAVHPHDVESVKFTVGLGLIGNMPDHNLGLGACNVHHPRAHRGQGLFARLLLEMTACSIVQENHSLRFADASVVDAV